MPVSQLFLLYPLNNASAKCVQDPENAHLVISLQDGRLAIAVDLDHVSRIPGCIMSFGRKGDVKISGSRISAIQCQFVLHETTREILFRDCSSHQSSTSTNRSEAKANQLSGVPRQVVVRVHDDVVIGMGGLHCDLYQFEIGWPMLDDEAYLNAEEDKRKFLSRPRNLRDAVTQDDTDTPAARYETRIQTPWGTERLVHRKLKQLGQGSFGTVFKTVDMHSGDYLAVKIIRLEPRQRHDIDWKKMMRREVEMLHSVYHPNLAEFRHCQGFRRDDEKIELFMTLYNGSLEDLLRGRPEYSTDMDLVGELLKQILKALVYLAHKSIIHRDIKPANMLFTADPEGAYHWYLADFGLAKFEDHNVTRAGSGHFRAPEILAGDRQTHKADVYSLGLTMLFVANSKGFRKRMSDSRPLKGSAEFELALTEAPRLKEMLHDNPERRWTAQQSYLGFFGGDPEISSQSPAKTRQEEQAVTASASVQQRRITIFGGAALKDASRNRQRLPRRGVKKARNSPNGTAAGDYRIFT